MICDLTDKSVGLILGILTRTPRCDVRSEEVYTKLVYVLLLELFILVVRL